MQIFHITRSREIRGKLAKEHAYGITSLTREKAGASRLLSLIREHWHIENKLHHVRDMTFREDQIRIRHKGKAQIMCAMRNTVITLVVLAGYSNVMEAIEAFGDHPELAFTILKKRRTE